MKKYSIGVDLGGTNLRVASYIPMHGLAGRRSARTRLELGPDVVAADMCRLIREVIALSDPQEHLVGICIAAPGPLDVSRGCFHQPPNLPGWDGFNLRDAVERDLDRNVAIENDANAAALAEWHLGSGKQYGTDSLCMLTLGTGVGHGIILDGQIVHGANGLAGEAGHITVMPEGEACACGNRGCLELYASATGIARQARERAMAGSLTLRHLLQKHGGLSADDLFFAATHGDEDARSIFRRAGSALGIAIATLINTLNPALVAVAGGVCDAWSLLEPSLLEEVIQRSYIYRLTSAGGPFQGKTKICKAVLGNEAGLLGAAIHPFLYASNAPRQSAFPAVSKNP